MPPGNRELARVCPACGATSDAKFCGECGAPLAPSPRATTELLKEDVMDSLGWDGRILRTVRDLLLHPVRIVATYMGGTRGRYLPPLKTFLTLTALYMVGVSFVRPPSFETLFGNPAKDVNAQALAQKIESRGLTLERVNERYQSRMNAVQPILSVLSLLPLVVVLKLMDRRRSWHQHLMFLLGTSNVVWLLALLALPIGLLGPGSYVASVFAVTLIPFAILFCKLYPGRSAVRTAGRCAVFITLDLVLGTLIQVPVSYGVYIASIFV